MSRMHYSCSYRYDSDLSGDAVADKVTQKLFVVKCKHILHHAQHVDGRVGKVLKPVLAPTRYTPITDTNVIITKHRATLSFTQTKVSNLA